ncbi:serine acetyltransferase [Halorubrum saccharovorum DSM 1137]|uniref:Serine acetyltransferase n=1 Tax=Halorubrum saccharovorum DSM 1137 TaxID=1227484 RepID=M0DPK5_9EURY|nr:serine acetyltransferase [Halorubrum saccharovorum]ELZ36069.1 serine acetyltransferase [Halorubrum saccharovorum DSM 1137]
MELLRRFLVRLRSDGLLMTVHLSIKFLTGINIINFYNAIIFREHTIATSCDISTCLPRSTELPHPVGIVVGHDVEIGSNVRIRQSVTIGRSEPDPDAGYPTIADDVSIGAGTVILGDIDLGEGCTTGANSVVVDDVPPHSTVVGVPAEEK